MLLRACGGLTQLFEVGNKRVEDLLVLYALYCIVCLFKGVFHLFDGLLQLLRVSDEGVKHRLLILVYDALFALRFEVFQRAGYLGAHLLSRFQRLPLYMFEEGVPHLVVAELFVGSVCDLTRLLFAELFGLFGAPLVFGVSDAAGVFACDGGLFLFVGSKGLQHLIVGFGLAAFPLPGGVGAFAFVLHPFAPNGVVVGECLVLGEILLSGGFLVGLFEALLPLFYLFELTLVGLIQLGQLLLQPFVHHFEVGVFDAFAGFSGELLNLFHRGGDVLLLLLEVFEVLLIGGCACPGTFVIRLAGHGAVFILAGVQLCFERFNVFEAPFAGGGFGANPFQLGFSGLYFLIQAGQCLHDVFAGGLACFGLCCELLIHLIDVGLPHFSLKDVLVFHALFVARLGHSIVPLLGIISRFLCTCDVALIGQGGEEAIEEGVIRCASFLILLSSPVAVGGLLYFKVRLFGGRVCPYSLCILSKKGCRLPGFDHFLGDVSEDVGGELVQVS